MSYSPYGNRDGGLTRADRDDEVHDAIDGATATDEADSLSAEADDGYDHRADDDAADTDADVDAPAEAAGNAEVDDGPVDGEHVESEHVDGAPIDGTVVAEHDAAAGEAMTAEGAPIAADRDDVVAPTTEDAADGDLAEPVVESEYIAVGVAEPVTDPMAESVTEPVPGSVMEPTDSVTEKAPESFTERVEEPVTVPDTIEGIESLAVPESAIEYAPVGDAGMMPGEAPVVGVASMAAPDAQATHDRWQQVQLGFIDDPRASVEAARAMVAEAVEARIDAIRGRQAALDAWQSEQSPDTEVLRAAMRSYREMLNSMTDGS